MIIVKLSGGLGNQLFQYAFGRSAAQALRIELRFDLTWFKHYRQRKYELGEFGVEIAAATAADWQQTIGFLTSFYQSSGVVAYGLRTRLGRLGVLPHYVVEPHFHYAHLRLQDNCVYEGYWQSPRYFETIKSDLIADFHLPFLPQNAHALALLLQIQNAESVCLHVRRTDYLTNRRYAPLREDYYHQAVALLSQSVENLTVFVFSDDLAWCKQNLNLALTTVFVENVVNLRDEFGLMCACKHHIIANSTLSWWAAWLNPNSEKKVVAPARWFADNSRTNDLLPSDWVLVDD